MLPKQFLLLALLLGVGIGLIVPAAIAKITSAHGSGGSAHDPHASGDNPPCQTRVQVSRSGTVTTDYPPELAIQLFTAEGEIQWLGDIGWNPAILRGDGFGRNDVFAVGGNTFTVINYDAELGSAAHGRVQAGKTAGIVDIKVTASGPGSVAEVTYNMTSLSDDGDKALAHMTDEAFAAEMARWQAAMEANDSKIQHWLASRN